ncbi:MAG: HAMP domain-containing histidine kinase [Prevotellaceae bacterium]|jgi:signal transduction histidine kinase|nr:HAMP domain-containing histidine kinase [Prevotellaceae bacterium]
MKIRTSLTLRYTGITAAIFFIFIVTIYGVNEHSRSATFFRDLKSEAVTKAHLFLNNQVDAATMQSIYLNNTKFINEVEVAVYDTANHILYHDALQNDIVKETPQMLKRIRRDKEFAFYIGDYQAVGIVYTFNNKEYLVTAAAYDGYGYTQRRVMVLTLGLMLVGGLTILLVVGYLLARSALTPIDALLARLEKSYRAQAMFVSNVSHELRTPMAALSGELDLALQKERTAPQYQAAIGNALQDARRVVKLIDDLLNLAKADYDPDQIKQEEVRLDELLLDARQLVLRAHADYRVELVFEQEADDDRALTVVANSYLLTTAFVNLIENNCKYSQNHTSFIQISFWEQWAIVRLSDDGVGMSDTDKQNLFKLFYRGENSNVAAGYGIGMALTQKIITLYHGEIAVFSEQGEGTSFLVKLPHVKS